MNKNLRLVYINALNIFRLHISLYRCMHTNKTLRYLFCNTLLMSCHTTKLYFLAPFGKNSLCGVWNCMTELY